MEDTEFKDAWEEIIKRINCMIKNNEEYNLKISWESRCTRCIKEPCLMRGHTEGLDCKDYRPY